MRRVIHVKEEGSMRRVIHVREEETMRRGLTGKRRRLCAEVSRVV